MSRMRFVLALLLLLAMSRPTLAQDDLALTAQLHALIAAHQGKVALYAADLRSGKSVAIDADTPVPTASVIKLAVLFEALKQVQAGRVRFDDRLTLTKADQVPGSGVLRLFDTPLAPTFDDALTLMIDVSDNTATNLAIDHLGLTNIDGRMRSIGLSNTWLYKKVFTPASGPLPADQPRYGLGKTTAREMASLIERFATCVLNAPDSPSTATPEDRALCDHALRMLKNQFDRNGIPRYLGDLETANKTGALDDVRNDVAIVYAPAGPVVISAFTYDNNDRRWTVDNRGELLLATLAKTIVDRWR